MPKTDDLIGALIIHTQALERATDKQIHQIQEFILESKETTKAVLRLIEIVETRANVADKTIKILRLFAWLVFFGIVFFLISVTINTIIVLENPMKIKEVETGKVFEEVK